MYAENLLGPRIETAWVEALSYPSGDVLGIANHIDLSTVQIDFNVDTRIMGGMKFDWIPPSTTRTPEFDWDRVLFRPWTRVNMHQWPWGVFIASSVTKTGSKRSVTLLDKTSLLDQDAPISTFSIQAGTNIIAAVLAILANRMPYETPDITASSKTTDVMMTWPAGTPYLTIINNLLEKADYMLLRVNGHGRLWSRSNVDPTRLTVQHVFEPGDLSIYEPDPQDTQDYLSVPNQVICTTQGTDAVPALLSVATNAKDDSRYSVQNRGRIISKTYTGVEAADQATLDSIASRNLWNSSTPVRTLQVDYAKVPLEISQIVMLNDVDSAADHTLFQVNEVSVKLDEGALVTGKWNEVTEEMGQLVTVVNPDSSEEPPAYQTPSTATTTGDGVGSDDLGTEDGASSDDANDTQQTTTTTTTTAKPTGSVGVVAKESPGGGGRLSTAQIRALATNVGFTGQDIEIAIAICMAESGGNPNATNYNPPTKYSKGSYDKGLWQINDINSGVIARYGGNRFDPTENAKMAKAIHDSNGWRAWSTYNNGAYRKFLGK